MSDYGLSLPLGAPGTSLSALAASLGSTGLVPGVFPVALAGTPYLLDQSEGPGLHLVSAARIRQQADASQRPGEQSLNPEGDWRRSFTTWHAGAGQLVVDEDDSLFSRYLESKGVDPWTEGELSLLNATKQSRTSVNANLYLASTGDRLYLSDGTALVYTVDPFAASPTYTPVTGTPGAAITGLATAGSHIFAATGGSGIYITEQTSGSASSWVTTAGSVDGVWFVKGRVMCTDGQVVYNPTTGWAAGPAALPTALFTHPNPSWTWVGMAEGLNNIYMAGYAGSNSLIYRTAVKDDGSGLEYPIVAGRLPEGEVVRSVGAYLEDFLLVGTDAGVRICNQDANGNLIVGALIETGTPVRDFEGEGQFVWFTWEDYDATTGGLGRLDLTTTTQRGAPAYASDLMVSTAADIVNVTTFNNLRVMTIGTEGVYVEDVANLVISGTLDTGDISYGLMEHKLAKSVVVTSTQLAGSGSIGVSLSSNRGASWEPLGTVTTGTNTTFRTNEMIGVLHRIRLTLSRDVGDTDAGPTVSGGISLRVAPHADSTQYWVAKLLVTNVAQARSGYGITDVGLVLETAQSLHDSQAIVTFQSLGTAYSVTMEDFDFAAHAPDADGSNWGGTLTVRLKVV